MSKGATPGATRTEWNRVDAMCDEHIDLSDNPEITPEMFARAVVRRGLRRICQSAHHRRVEQD